MGKSFKLYLWIFLLMCGAQIFNKDFREDSLSEVQRAVLIPSPAIASSESPMLKDKFKFPSSRNTIVWESTWLSQDLSSSSLFSLDRTGAERSSMRTRRKLADCTADNNCSLDSGSCNTAISDACLVCNEGWYSVPGFDCRECPSTCATCDLYGCLTCPDTNDCCPTHRSNFDTTTLVCGCTDPACADCNPYACLTCFADTDCCTTGQTLIAIVSSYICSCSDCLTCEEDGVCLICSDSTDCCTAPYQFDADTRACLCPDNCLTCDDTGCIRCYLDDTTCCPDGRVHDGTECVQCDSTCDTCDSEGCLTCVGSDQTCCPDGRFFNLDTSACEDCRNPNCATCTSTECLTCVDNATECCDYPKSVNTNAKCCESDCIDCDEFGCTSCQPTALDCCSDGFYIDGFVCGACPSTCATCDGEGCLTCPTGVTDCCDNGRYYNASTETCENCPTPNDECATCDADGCLTCVSGTDCCPTGKYHDGSECLDCDGECTACTESADGCTSCRNSSLSAPECCPEDQNDDNQDGVCDCDILGAGTISDCACLDGQVSVDEGCVAIISLSGPTSVSETCTGEILTFTATVNVSVSGYEWTVDPTSADLDNTLGSESSGILNVPLSQLSVGSYTFTVTITTSGQAYSASQTVEVNSDTLFLFLSSSADSIDIACDRTETIEMITTNPCTTALTYSWSSSPEGISSAEPVVTLDPAVLSYGTYSLTATITSGDGNSISESIIVNFDDPGIEAVIEPASYFQSADEDLVLDGSSSQGSGLTYSWSCSGDDCPSFSLNSDSSTATASSSDLNNGMTFEAVLTVSISSCTSSVSQRIAIEPCFDSSTVIVDPDSDYTPPVSSGYKVVRTRETYPEEEDDLTGTQRDNWLKTSCARKSSTTIRNESIEAGQCYTFEVENCIDSVTRLDTFIIFGNQAPVCSSSPVEITGTGADKTLTITGCENIEDTSDTLTYTLLIDSSTEINNSTSNTTTFTFTDGQTVELSGQVCDSFEDCTSFTQSYTYSA